MLTHLNYHVLKTIGLAGYMKDMTVNTWTMSLGTFLPGSRSVSSISGNLWTVYTLSCLQIFTHRQLNLPHLDNKNQPGVLVFVSGYANCVHAQV